ncbi:DJ-1/PfpI family protein [Nocardioides sp. GY 10127]|uniref:DJ-1/PfpI family protein n=1 Tax=Nocardioides sp. GY 10127 TaxID=2569762 RepID=UPI0010A8A4AE|nr:DJ-1/PfpI family protein [Nocardioides sp. GY 10127]TIC84186.1 DJ-1/PfpI family protein [Nocardioides sp. GY 10127]
MTTTTPATRTVGILAFDEMEVLDHAGPYEVFNVAGDLAEEAGGVRAYRVVSIGVTTGAGTPEGRVTGRGGFTVLPDHTLADAPAVDLLVVPGGAGTRALLGDDTLAAFLRERAGQVEGLLGVCTGALLLASAGLLAGRRAVTHHLASAELAALEPEVEVVEGRRFVRTSERTWTSGGISAGIDLALHVVEELSGRALRDAVVDEMEWGWGS